MLQTNELVISLHNYLLSSGSYDLDEDASASERIFDEWNDRLLAALQTDFTQHAQVSLQFSNSFFELFGDRGESVWGVHATTVVDESEPGLFLGQVYYWPSAGKSILDRRGAALR